MIVVDAVRGVNHGPVRNDPFVFQWLVAAFMMIAWALYLLNALEPDDAAG